MVLSFNGRVNIAIRKVTEAYPEAKLYEALGVCTTGFTNDPTQLDELKVVFQVPGSSTLATVIIESTGYSEFGEPKYIEEPWLEDIVIPWPIDMDIGKANELKEAAGFKEPYLSVTLRNPLGPNPSNPSFIFGNRPGEVFVFVDTITGKVFESR